MTEAKAENTVTFELNGKSVVARKGMTVMEVARRENVTIPHFCWHPGLSVAGVCRFCMVEVEGRPKLEIACNLQVTDGMKVRTDTDRAKETHKWALEFHLVNHPLDCPICDQAGECGLQDYYMSVGRYKSEMERPKVLKPKALDVGGDLVLDTERCILCSRCVRFEEEVTKSGALGIFDRGDRAVVGTYPDRKIQHNYTANLVDICPVGAFTSKDFRFRQRVWFLKDKQATCPGCATGCQTKVFAKPQVQKFFRMKPAESEVNKFWMCDKGRHMYAHLNREERLLFAKANGQSATVAETVNELAQVLKTTAATDVALLVSAQYTNEEYESLFSYFVGKLGVKTVLQWREPTEKRDDFDGVLYRGDHNANTRGLMEAMKKYGVGTDVKNQFDEVAQKRAKVVVAICPEVPETFPSLDQQLHSLSELSFVSMWGLTYKIDALGFKNCIPLKGFAEKTGTFLNFEGKPGKLDCDFPSPVTSAVTITDVVELLEQKHRS